MSCDKVLAAVGDFIELKDSDVNVSVYYVNFVCHSSTLFQVKYGVLLVCANAPEQKIDFCVIRKLESYSAGATDEPILNDVECPLLFLSHELFVVSPRSIVRPISIVHQCSDSCSFQEDTVVSHIEYQETTHTSLVFKHDFTNNLYCFNIFCCGNY